MYIFSCNDNGSLNYWNGGQLKHVEHEIMPILRLIEPVARLSISCDLFYLFHKDWWVIV